MSRNRGPSAGTSRCSEGLKVLYVAVHDREYPRNSRVRGYLERTQGASVDVLLLDKRPGYWRHVVNLLRQGLIARGIGYYDVVVLAELSVQFAPASWLLAKLHRSLHVVDFYVGLFETHVEDRQAHRRLSTRALAYRLLDRFAVASADLVLTDTDARASRWSKTGSPVITLPLGAPSWARPQPRAERRGPVGFLYYGNYIPLHGVPKVLEAIALLRQNLPLYLTLVGSGDHRATAERMVESLGLEDCVTFIDYVPQEQLAALIGRHDVVLGTFGASPKATSVIANKVWQGLACGRAVVTAAGPGIDELLPIAANQLFVTSSAEPSDIARQLASAARARPGNQHVHCDLEEYVERRFRELGAGLACASACRSSRSDCPCACRTQ